jgi:putative ABC transport system ATP-binding protein
MNKLTGDSGMETIVEARELRRTYRLDKVEVEALRGVNLAVAEGEFVAIVGASGSGKSTLLHILGLMDTPTSGEALFRGRGVTRMSDGERTKLRLRDIGFVFQTFNLLPTLTAFGNVEIALRLAGVSRSVRKEKAKELLEKVGIGHRLNHLPRELSGGERQRVAIARALANSPKLVLADEPTGNLDSAAGMAIAGLFHLLNKEKQTIVLVTHNQEMTQQATRTLTMRDGQITDAL